MIWRLAVFLLGIVLIGDTAVAEGIRQQVNHRAILALEGSVLERQQGSQFIFAVVHQEIQIGHITLNQLEEIEDQKNPEFLSGLDLIEDIASRYGRKYNVDAALVMAVIEAESSFRVDAVSRAGAQGLMQLMPETGKELGVVDAFCPEQNIGGGVRYLKQLTRRFEGDVRLALAAYNAGPGNVSRFGNSIPPFPETVGFVEKVFKIHQQSAEAVIPDPGH